MKLIVLQDHYSIQISTILKGGLLMSAWSPMLSSLSLMNRAKMLPGKFIFTLIVIVFLITLYRRG
jgi:hypothetical protein